jgi:hypothetical protein
VQIGATPFGVLLIWLIYTSIRCDRWIPTPTDSVFPFFIGLIEFTPVGLGPERLSPVARPAVIFAAAAWVSQITLRRARLDGDNDAYFASVTAATRRLLSDHRDCSPAAMKPSASGDRGSGLVD